MWTNILPPSPDEHPLPLACDFHEADKLRYRDILYEILHAGVGIVRTLELRSANATMDGTNAVIEAAASYERVTRSMRRTILLATNLTDPDPRPEPTHRAEPLAQATPAPETPRPARETPEHTHERIDRLETLDDTPIETVETVEDTEPTNPEDHPESPDDEPERIESEAHQGPLDFAAIPAQIAAIHADLDANLHANLYDSPRARPHRPRPRKPPG